MCDRTPYASITATREIDANYRLTPTSPTWVFSDCAYRILLFRCQQC